MAKKSVRAKPEETKEPKGFFTTSAVEAEKIQKATGNPPEVKGQSMFGTRKYIFPGMKDEDAEKILGKK